MQKNKTDFICTFGFFVVISDSATLFYLGLLGFPDSLPFLKPKVNWLLHTRIYVRTFEQTTRFLANKITLKRA